MATKAKPTKPPLPAEEVAIVLSGWGDRVTTVAFFIGLALVVARATTMEILRDPSPAIPNAPGAPHGAGAVTTLVLDLLCWVPAMLVLVRRAFDKKYFLRFAWSFVALLGLGIWATLSVFWSADKFAAAVGGFTFLSAGLLVWAMAQLVRSWMRLRVVAATCVGLLMVFIAAGVTYRFLDLPDLQKNWPMMKEQTRRERGWDENSFAAKQFEKKILAGEMAGFDASPNTFAATTVLCCVITAGLTIQRRRDGIDSTGAVLPVLIILFGFWLIFYTDSRTAFATPVIAAMMLVAAWKLGPWLHANSKKAYLVGAILVLVGAAAVIGHGLVHNALVHVSLTFRWKYWVGAMRLCRANPIFGVGWDNFGLFYPSARLAEAAEEVKDPHNMIVRAFAELGIVGGALMLAWIARFWWETTRPVEPSANVAKRPCPINAVVYFALLSVVAFGINLFANVDFAQEWSYVFLECLRRVLWVLLFTLGTVGVTLMSLNRSEFDDRPAPWLLYGMLVAIAVFLVHNLIDFSMFEIGPMFLFALVLGSVLGVRLPNPERAPVRGIGAGIALAVVVIAWLSALFVLVIPTADAESFAQGGDASIRKRELLGASQQFDAAFGALPINADYAFRAARAMIMRDAPADEIRGRLALAIAGNKPKVEYYLTRAHYEMLRPPNDQDYRKVRADFESALRYDPYDVQTRLEFAKAMELDERTLAREQYQIALDNNDKLNADEPKRLTPEEVERIKQKIGLLATTRPAVTTKPE